MNIFQWIWDFINSVLGISGAKPWTPLIDQPGKAWWIKVITHRPDYTYYFGPFESRTMAEERRSGFIEDLQAEGAGIARVNTLFCKPSKLTLEGMR